MAYMNQPYNPYMNYTQQYNPYNQYNSYGQQQLMQQQPIQQTPQPQQPMIYGKVVDGIDVVRAIDIPLGNTYVCPKADMSAIYIKTWNNDGTTRVISYVPQIEQKEQEVQKDLYSDTLASIQMKIEEIDKKVSTLI